MYIIYTFFYPLVQYLLLLPSTKEGTNVLLPLPWRSCDGVGLQDNSQSYERILVKFLSRVVVTQDESDQIFGSDPDSFVGCGSSRTLCH